MLGYCREDTAKFVSIPRGVHLGEHGRVDSAGGGDQKLDGKVDDFVADAQQGDLAQCFLATALEEPEHHQGSKGQRPEVFAQIERVHETDVAEEPASETRGAGEQARLTAVLARTRPPVVSVSRPPS